MGAPELVPFDMRTCLTEPCGSLRRVSACSANPFQPGGPFGHVGGPVNAKLSDSFYDKFDDPNLPPATRLNTSYVFKPKLQPMNETQFETLLAAWTVRLRCMQAHFEKACAVLLLCALMGPVTHVWWTQWPPRACLLAWHICYIARASCCWYRCAAVY